MSKDRLRNNSKLDLVQGRFKLCLTIRYKQLRNYANPRNIHVRRVRHLRDRFDPLEEYPDEAFHLRFRLRKDSVSDLVRILDKDLQHQTRRGINPIAWMSKASEGHRMLRLVMYPLYIDDLKIFSASQSKLDL